MNSEIVAHLHWISPTTLLTIISIGLLSLQGGFSDLSWCLTGIVITIILLTKKEIIIPRKRTVILIVLLPVTYLLSAVWHGSPPESFMETAKIAIFCICLLTMYNMRTVKIDQVLCVSGLFVAITGILAYCGFLPLPGIIQAARLQGLFQYANVTAIFMVVCVFICRTQLIENTGTDYLYLQASKKYKDLTRTWIYCSLMDIGIILTQSAGAILVYILGMSIYGIKNRQVSGLYVLAFLQSAAVAFLIILCVRSLQIPYPAILPPFAMILLTPYIKKWIHRLLKHDFIPSLCLVLLYGSGFLLLILRNFQPLRTYAERLIQISDGAGVILRHPLGIGPGAWEFQMPAHQSAYYTAVKLHSGYFQIGVDAGIIAFLIVIALIAVFIRLSIKLNYSIAAGMILFHAGFDISFSFLALVMLLSMVLIHALPTDEERLIIAGNKLLIASSIPFICAFAVLFTIETGKNQARWNAKDGDIAQAIETLKPYIRIQDTEACLLTMRYALQSRNDSMLYTAFSSIKADNALAYLLLSEHYYMSGEYIKAADMALFAARASPFSPDVYNWMKKIEVCLPYDMRNRYASGMEMIRADALQRENPLSQYLN